MEAGILFTLYPLGDTLSHQKQGGKKYKIAEGARMNKKNIQSTIPVTHSLCMYISSR